MDTENDGEMVELDVDTEVRCGGLLVSIGYQLSRGNLPTKRGDIE